MRYCANCEVELNPDEEKYCHDCDAEENTWQNPDGTFKFKVINRVTKETREVVVTMEQLQEYAFESIMPCCGPCECSLEPDGVCENGWPSRGDLLMNL